MPTEDNKALIRRFVHVWGQESLSTVDELASATFSAHYPVLPEPLRGPEAFKQFLTQFRTAFPDVQVAVDDEIAEGDKVVVHWTARGTHQADFLSIPATGRQATWTGITIYRIENGKVVEERGVGDTLGLMQQLGAIPAPGQT